MTNTITAPTTGTTWRNAAQMSDQNRRQWLDAIDSFGQSQEAKGVPPVRRRQMTVCIRRFAVFFDKNPWHATPAEFEAWFDSLEGLAPTTRQMLRSALRSFYRWAFETGRIQIDPTELVAHRSLRRATPPLWDEPITAFERHLRARGVAASTIKSWSEGLRTAARAMPSLNPFEATLDDIYDWMASQANWTRETRRGRRVMIRMFFAWAVDTGRMQINPALKLPKVKGGEPVARPATDEEYRAALAAADDRWGLALRLAAELGLRRAEVACVHSADVTQRADGTSWLTVHGKGSKVRRLPLPASLALTLRAQEPGYVFPGRIVDKHAHASGEGHMSPRYMGKRIQELLPPGVTMHALRHRFATRVYNVNRDVFTVQALLGHASPATTRRYVQVADERMRELVEAVNP